MRSGTFRLVIQSSKKKNMPFMLDVFSPSRSGHNGCSGAVASSGE